MQIGIDRGKSPVQMGFDALDALYLNRVSRVEIESDVTCKKSMAFEIAHCGREPLGASMPGFNNVDYGASRRGPDGKLVLYEKIIPITQQIPAKLEIAGFPDLLLIVDSSGSMQWDPRAGSGPYDSLLRAIYSVFHFLEKHGKAQYMRFAAVNFSATTLKTAWHRYGEWRKIKELLFRHQNGGTRLNYAVIRGIVEESPDRFLCLFITDCQISNAAEVVDTIRMTVSRGHGFVLIQVGRSSPLAEQIRKAGLPVHIITDHRQLEGLCLEYAKETW